MIRAANVDPIRSKRRAITALFLHVAWQEPSDQREEALNRILRAARASRTEEFIWYLDDLLIDRLFNEESPVSAKQAAILISPYISLESISRWAAAASVVPFTDEISQSVVTVLLRIASSYDLRTRVPVGMWSWLKKRPLLPPGCTAGHERGAQDAVQMIRALGDIEILTSYLYLVWSECYAIPPGGLEEMRTSIRYHFGGIRVGYNREDLLRRLDYILGQLDLGLRYLRQHEPSLNEDEIREMKRQYGQLKEVLLEVDRKAIDRLIRESLGFVIAFRSTDTSGQALGATQRSCVRFPSHACSRASGSLHTSSLDRRLCTVSIDLDITNPPGVVHASPRRFHFGFPPERQYNTGVVAMAV